MFKIDSSGNIAGLFTDGNPITGQQPTVVSDEWLNAVQTELVSVVQASGITLDKANSSQVLAALRLLFRARQAWKRQFVYANESTIAGFNGHTVYDVGELPTSGGEIFEATTIEVDLSVLYSMVVHVSAGCTAHVKFLYNDDAGLLFVDGVQAAGLDASHNSLQSDDVALEAGDHLVQVLGNNSLNTKTQIALAEWMTGLPITWLRAATA